MTYCVALKLEEGLLFASDSRTHAGVDNYARFCKMTLFERLGERVIVMLSSGGLAGTQAVISVLRQRIETGSEHLLNAPSMFEVANRVSDAMRHIDRRDTPHMGEHPFNASFIVGGQIKGRPMQLFRVYAEGNFIEAGVDTPFLQTGEAKYGKPIIDRVITTSTSLADGIKCLLQAQCPQGCDVSANRDAGLPQLERAKRVPVDPGFCGQFGDGKLAAGSGQPNAAPQILDALRDCFRQYLKFTHFIVHHKVKTTGFSRSALAAKICC